MALKEFRGDAAAVAEVKTIQLTGYDVATTYTLTITGTAKAISVLGTGGTVNTTATALAAAWNLSTIPEIAEITASATTDTVTLTHDTAGVEFEITASVSGGSGTIGSATTTVDADGPKVWSAKNFGGTLPTNSDDVVILGPVEILYGLAQSSITLASLTVRANALGAPKIGLPFRNTGNYTEYRERYLKISATAISIGDDLHAETDRLQIDTGSNATAIKVYKGRNVLLAGSHSTNTLQVFGGAVFVATESGKTAQFATISANGNAYNEVGSGTTLATHRSSQNAASRIKCAVTTLATQGAPRVIVEGTGAVGTLEANSYIDYRSSGTITQIYGGPTGQLDLTQNLAGVTITNAELAPGFTINDTSGKATFSNAYTIPNGSLHDITHRTGRDVSVLVAYV